MSDNNLIKIKGLRFKNIRKNSENILKLEKLIKKELKTNITKLIEALLGGAINLNSSDIHIEPKKENTKIRLRLDGMLHGLIDFDKKTYQRMVSRIKLLSGLKINISDKAQDGRFTIKLPQSQIEIRTSALPSEYGESIVMRILNPKNLIEVENLGIREEIRKTFEKEIEQPNGLIVVTGPTGSGKTTTLYAILKKIQTPEIKIVTIEDPIEYHLKGISQTQVNPSKGYDFASGLKAIVRQDPDVILVGEIRDFETAEIALQASLTGHLVLTTLHTNDAAGTIVRLKALGEKAENIGPALNLAIGQRLTRKVCSKCHEFKKASSKELATLKQSLNNIPSKIKIPELNKNLKIPKANPKGCKDCNFTGYKGRIGIFEFFLNDSKIKDLIFRSPSISELKKAAQKQGMVEMRQDGLIKVLRGITTIEEIDRITKK